MDESFGKEYKLCSKKIIDQIFSEGKVVKEYPFFLRYLPAQLSTPKTFQLVISVPKAKFKKAVDRNRIKRLIRESVRKKKYLLESELSKQEFQLALFIVYTETKEETYQKISDKIEVLFLRLVKELK
ncbi:MAG: ribonuclease P protein component [Brumimicrobium sp.]|nr:ribonuclease P protein component [Brumimicrobium sp.]MCO5269780.1 ribonuclease P protein component [Brumimicrobium sp.]